MTLLLLFIVCLVFLALFWLTPLGVPALKKMANGQLPPDLRFGYRPDAVYALLDVYGASGIAHWQRMLCLDMLFPVCYGALLSLAGSHWTQAVQAGTSWQWAALLVPVAAAACDYAENLLLLKALAALPVRRDGMVQVASGFTRLKLVCLLATLALPLAHWAGRALV